MANESRHWHQFNAEDQVLGRLATKVATLLMGKHKPSFARYKDMGDYVVITNVEKVQLTGAKEMQKEYQRYSGYPSGLKTRSAAEMRTVKPEEILRQAVSGMLPANRLRDRMMARLKLVVGSENPFQNHFSK